MEEVDGQHDYIIIHHPDVGLGVTLLSNMTQMEHHPRVSFFLLTLGTRMLGQLICC